MKIFRLITSLVLLIMVSACTTATTQTAYPTTDKWATGGTLHESTIAEWIKASYSNRLATSADFVVYYFGNYLGINDFSDLDKRKQAATDLEECISTAASGGGVDNEQVTTIATVCSFSLWPNNTDQNYPSNSNDISWATGGTLHKSTIAEWRKASYLNRLATSADFSLYYFGYALGINYMSDSEIDKIKKEATDLEECISITASGGDVDNEEVARIAALCLLLIWPSGSNSSPSSSYNSSPNTVYAKDLVKITKYDWDCSHDSIGNMIFEGKVKNTSSIYDLQFVKLRATVFSESGEVINTNIGYIDSDILYANSSSTFTIYVDDPNYEGKRCKVEVEDGWFK